MIRLDLKTDLAKVTPETIGSFGMCKYSSPCAVGAMMTSEERDKLVNTGQDFHSFWRLISKGTVTIPNEQLGDFTSLQTAFDMADAKPDQFWTTLQTLKEKYHVQDT